MQTAMAMLLCAVSVCVAMALPTSALTTSSARQRQARADVEVVHGDKGPTVNPISKVLDMLENMAKSVEADAACEKAMFSKYMGYCNTSKGRLRSSIRSGNARLPELQSSLEDAQAAVASLRVQLDDQRGDRAWLSKDIDGAKIRRGSRRAKHVEETASLTGYVDALRATIQDAQVGTRGAFLQRASPAATELVRKAAADDQQITDDDRQTVLAFLGGQAAPQDRYVPSSGEVVSILKAMLEDYSKDVASENEAEQDAQASFVAWSTSKAQALKALNAAISGKTSRVGELEVQTVRMKRQMASTEAALTEDSKYLVDLQENCENKAAEYSHRVELRGEELSAIREAITALNGSDAMQLFQRMLSADGSFAQTSTTAASGRDAQDRRGDERRKLAALAVLARVPPSQGAARPEVLFLEVALQRSQLERERIARTIDEIVTLLSKQQAYEENKQDYCREELRRNVGANSSIEDLTDSVFDFQGGIKTFEMDVHMAQANVAVLDKFVTEASQRQNEVNVHHDQAMSERNKAIAVLQYARQCIDDFYRPQSQGAAGSSVGVLDQVTLAEEFVASDFHSHKADDGSALLQTGKAGMQKKQQTHRSQQQQRQKIGAAALDPVPEVWGAYHRKVEESSAILERLDFVLRGLKQEAHAVDQGEGKAAELYETFMEVSARDRAKYMKTLSMKQRARSNAEAAKTAVQGELTAELAGMHTIRTYLGEVHSDCVDFLKNVKVNKEARATEAANLQAAKDVLVSPR